MTYTEAVKGAMNIFALDWVSVPNARPGDDVASYLQREGAPGAAALKHAFDTAPLLGTRTVRDEVPARGTSKPRGRGGVSL